MSKKILRYIGTFTAVLCLFWALLILTSLIPNGQIKKNLQKSEEFYKSAEAFSFEQGQKMHTVSDNYADAILLNILWNIDSKQPVLTSLDTKYCDGGDYGVNWGLHQALNGKKANCDYSRYWHGSVIFLRPLLLITDVQGIKKIGLAAVLLLAVCNLLLLLKKEQYFVAASLAISLLCIHIWDVRLALEYLPAFLVSLMMCLLFLWLEEKGDDTLMILSVVSGVSIAFFDFLTSETLAILLPLILVVLVRWQDDRLGTFPENIRWLVRCVCCWGISYVMTFLVKWTAASIATGENKFRSAIQSAGVRFAGTSQEENLPLFKQIPYAVFANLSTLFGGEGRVDFGKILIGLLIALLIFGGGYYLFRGKEKQKDVTRTVLVLGAVPYLRYLILNNHSYLHEFFTYRAQAVTIIALCAVVWCNREPQLFGGKTQSSKAKSSKMQGTKRASAKKKEGRR